MAGDADHDDTAGEQSDTRSLRSSEPGVMRALAHPLRIEMLDVLDELLEATASDLAQRLGQTVANCSFHLKILAAGGFIERAEPRGREKPWRIVHQSRDLRPDATDPVSVAESSTLGSLYVQKEAARMVKFLHDAPSIMADPEWVHAVTVNSATFWATADELRELAEDIHGLVDRFSGRQEPDQRPDGARRARFFATLNPELNPEDLERLAADAEESGVS